MGQIHELMPLVMRDVGAIGKNKKASMGGAGNYKYRGIDDVLDAIHPVLVEHKISTSMRCADIRTETVIEKKPNDKDRMIYRTLLSYTITFFAPDGSHVESTAAGEGMDYGGDKASNKAMANGHKYAICLGLNIPVTDIADGDATASEQSPADEPPKELSVMEQLRRQQAADAQSGQQSPPPASEFRVHENDFCRPEQIERIKALAKQVGMGPDGIKSAVTKRGKAKLAELTYGQAAEVVANLERKAAAQDANKVF